MALTRKHLKGIVRNKFQLWTNEGYRLMPEDLLNELCNRAQRLVRIDLEDVTENHYSNTVANQRSYTLPSDLLLLKEVWISRDVTKNFQGYRLEPFPYSHLVKIESRFSTLQPTGRPERYTVSDDNIIYFDPVPSSELRFDVFYVPVPSDMTDDGDIPDFKDFYHDLVSMKLMEITAVHLPGVDPSLYKQLYEIDLRRYKPLANRRMSRFTPVRYSGYFRGPN